MVAQIKKEEVIHVLKQAQFNYQEYFDFIFDAYHIAVEMINQLQKVGIVPETSYINHVELIYYILGEFTYSTNALLKSKIEEMIKDEEFLNTIATTSADKFISLGVFRYSEERMSNRYIPTTSSLDVYLNFILRILNNHKKNKPEETLISDLLVKSTSLARCILNLCTYGYEAEAFSSWRTLHECECTLLILTKYGEPAIKSYIKHMNYGIVFRHGAGSKEKTDKVFEEIKAGMREHDLKSKDMKKYIEYGWLYSIDDFNNSSEYKLNFRDGMEPLAGLQHYKDNYTQSSELIHCTPLLIYSNKQYFHYLCLLSLYESFFRIEKVFSTFIDEYIPLEAQDRYKDMKKVYFSQLVSIHKIESAKFEKIVTNN